MITKQCLICGKNFQCYPSADRKYCSRACAAKMQTVKMKQTEQEFTCEQCGKKFYLTAREIKNKARRGMKTRFCSRQCKDAFWGRNRVKQVCCICGKTFLIQAKDAGPHRCCSPECSAQNEYNRRLYKKEDPTNMYIIRKSKEYKRWHRKIQKRDKGQCQHCNNPFNLPVQVHHKVRLYDIAKTYNFNVQDVLNSQEFNDINNGITLCLVCHAKEHPENIPMQKALEYETYLKSQLGRPEPTVAEDSVIISEELSRENVKRQTEVFWDFFFDDLINAI